MAAIEVTGLEKHYAGTPAVDGISFEVSEGEVFALLGPNGAGKTTTVEILEGHRRRDGGGVRVLGVDPESGGRAFRERIGIVLQSSGIEGELTARETVELFAPMYPDPRGVDEVLEIVELTEKADDRVKTYSGGQQRRLDLALGIVGRPDLIFLDEPTTGFDPSARRRSWSTIDNLRSLGTTILLTTHYMDEAQALADRVAVIARGRIVAEGTPDTLGGRADAASLVRFGLPAGLGPGDLPAGIGAVEAGSGRYEITATAPTETVHRLSGWAVEQGIELVGLEVTRPSLEDVYLELTEDADG
ncbi:MAG: ATP-binding cassette domain-containing protein [Acidimicrobiia bacterium]|nr:ATP-binding cassette domain-containing protein [Acidimicrobiia bacterium]